MTVVSMRPTDGTTEVNGSDPIKITFSASWAADSPMPTLTPNRAGSWSRQGGRRPG